MAFGITPKKPIGADDNEIFPDFTHPADVPVTKTNVLIGKLGDIRRTSLEYCIFGKSNVTSSRMFYRAESNEFPPVKLCANFRQIVKIKRVNIGSRREST